MKVVEQQHERARARRGARRAPRAPRPRRTPASARRARARAGSAASAGRRSARGRRPRALREAQPRAARRGGCRSSCEQVARPTRTPSSSRVQLVEQSGLAEAGRALDLDQRHARRRLRARWPPRAVSSSARAAEEADGPAARVSACAPSIGRGRSEWTSSWRMTADLERACLRGRLEAELLVEPRAVAAVAAKRLVLAAERVEGEHLRAVGAFAEAVERDRRLGVRERRARSRARRARRRLRRGARRARVPGSCREGRAPRGRTARLRARRRARATSACSSDWRAMRVGSRAERSSSSSKRSRSRSTASVAKRYASASVTTSCRARSRSATRWRRRTETNVWIEPRCRRRPRRTPDQLGDAVDRDTVAARREQDLEQLLRTNPAEIARAEHAFAVHDLERAEEPDDEARTARGSSPEACMLSLND